MIRGSGGVGGGAARRRRRRGLHTHMVGEEGLEAALE
jgi:hypothetical protein